MLNQKKAPCLDIVTARMLKELSKGLVHLMYIFNPILWLEYWPKSLKIVQIIMIPKPGKNPMDVSPYQPISLVLTISKLLEKLILKKSIKTWTHKTGSQSINLDSDRPTPQCKNATAKQISPVVYETDIVF